MLLATLLKTAPSLGTNQGLGRPIRSVYAPCPFGKTQLSGEDADGDPSERGTDRPSVQALQQRIATAGSRRNGNPALPTGPNPRAAGRELAA
jgi:hypothetical protein